MHCCFYHESKKLLINGEEFITDHSRLKRHQGVEESRSGEEVEDYAIVDHSLACNYPSQPYVDMRGAFIPPGWKKVYKRKRANDTSSSRKKLKLFH